MVAGEVNFMIADEVDFGEKTGELLAERDVQKILIGAVHGLFDLYEDSAVHSNLPGSDVAIDSLALIGPNKPNHASSEGEDTRLGYHYAYTALTLNGLRAGIIVANAKMLNPLFLSKNRNQTLRHYETKDPSELYEEDDTSEIIIPRATVHRYDWEHAIGMSARKSDGPEINMEATLATPLGIGDPTADFVTDQFRKEIIELGISTPVRPLTDLFPAFLDI